MKPPPLGNYLLDCSAVVKLLVDEPGPATERARSFLRRWEGHTLHIAEFTFVEVCSVLKRKWLRDETIDRKKYVQAIGELRSNLESGIWKLRQDELSETAYWTAAMVATAPENESLKLDLLDVLLLKLMSETLDLRTAVLVVADAGLAKYANAEKVHFWHITKDEAPTFQTNLAEKEDIGALR